MDRFWRVVRLGGLECHRGLRGLRGFRRVGRVRRLRGFRRVGRVRKLWHRWFRFRGRRGFDGDGWQRGREFERRCGCV